MKIKLRQRRNNNKWYNVPIEEIKAKSLVAFVEEEFDATICTAYDEEEKPFLVVANTSDMKDYCDKSGIAFMYASDMMDLLTGSIGISLVAEVFPDSEFIEVKPIEPEKE